MKSSKGTLKLVQGAVSCELGLKETSPPTGDTQHGEHGVVPLIAGQMTVVCRLAAVLTLTWSSLEKPEHQKERARAAGGRRGL